MVMSNPGNKRYRESGQWSREALWVLRFLRRCGWKFVGKSNRGSERFNSNRSVPEKEREGECPSSRRECRLQFLMPRKKLQKKKIFYHQNVTNGISKNVFCFFILLYLNNSEDGLGEIQLDFSRFGFTF